MTDEAFENAVRAYGDTLFRVACHALGNRTDAEDIVQTVFLKLYRESKPFESEEHLKHWLLRVTVNESRRMGRSPWRQRVVPLEQWDGAFASPGESGILEAVMALEPKYRLSIYLYYYEGLSVVEVARALHAKESTVQTWLHRARAKLRQALLEEEEGMDHA